jgi:hypothetical protein
MNTSNLVLSLQPGSHGFNMNTSVNQKWLGEALQTAVTTWLELSSMLILRGPH